MTTKATATPSKASAPTKKPPVAKPSSNPFVSAHAARLDRAPKHSSKGSHRGGR